MNQNTVLGNPSTETGSEGCAPNKQAVIYLRVSSVGQMNKAHDPEGYSIPGQREACERYARSIDAQIVAEFVEPGKSGTSTNRPALQRMLSELPDLQPDYVIFYDLSRVAREDFDALWLLREIESHGCQLKSTLERFDDSPAGRLLYTVMAGVNAYRSRGDAEKVKLGLERKHQAGGSHGPARLGYLNVREEVDGRQVASIAVDPDRGSLISTLFELAASGEFTVSSLTDLIADAGLRTRPTATRPSKPVARTTVHRILRDDYYIGIVTRNGVKASGRHEALTARETFERVQAILDANRAGGERSRKHNHYLNGSLFCGKCGSRLGFGRHRGKCGQHYDYYSCLSRMRSPGPCGAPYARTHEIEAAVEAEHFKALLSPTESRIVRDTVREFADGKARIAQSEADRHERRLRELRDQQRKLLQLFYRDAVNEEVLREEQQRIAKEEAQVERWQEHAAWEVSNVMEALDEALSLLESSGDAYARAEPAVRKLLNRAIFARIEVETDEDGDAPVVSVQLAEVYEKIVETAAVLIGAAASSERTNPDPIFLGRGSHLFKLAEREGFEPSDELTPVNSFRDCPVQPLRHLSAGKPSKR